MTKVTVVLEYERQVSIVSSESENQIASEWDGLQRRAGSDLTKILREIPHSDYCTVYPLFKENWLSNGNAQLYLEIKIIYHL